jgi:hypothetical protein
MKITKFEGIGRGLILIKIHFNEKSILITGELTITPIFYADISSIKKWDPPYENEEIDDSTRNDIIESIENYTKEAKVKVLFD